MKVAATVMVDARVVRMWGVVCVWMRVTVHD